jgi:RHS repeat-associated protein
LNLIKKVSLNGTTLVNYSYLAEGTGLEYRGSLQDQANRYRYNGKEEQSLFGFAYSDYGARQYSASTGRWLSMDPLSEKYYSVSPYTFCANNPVNFVDLDGRYFDKSNARKADRYERRI